MKPPRTNVAPSVHARLLNRARERQEDFNLTLKRYTAERFLYRLGASRHRDLFVLKGAMLFALWGGSLYRATRDLDLTGFAEDNPQVLVGLVKEICAVPCPSDALRFLPASVRAEPIIDKSEYHGFRVKLEAMLGTARLALQIDVGLGNAIEPPALEEEYPVLLDGPAPVVRTYSREAVVAEKLHAMVVLGVTNTRFKDFYDILVLATRFAFSGPSLTRAIAATFENRKTSFQRTHPHVLTAVFYADTRRASEWSRYLSRSSLAPDPAEFSAVGERLTAFLDPPWRALVQDREFTDTWPASGPWVPPEREAVE